MIENNELDYLLLEILMLTKKANILLHSPATDCNKVDNETLCLKLLQQMEDELYYLVRDLPPEQE